MNTLSYKTISINKAAAKKEWVVVDATDQVLGRLCTKVAKHLRGKYKPEFTPNVDCGDNVIIVTADKIRITGNKMTDRVYLSYTGYPGGQRKATPASILAKPNGADKLIHKVVKGMLPRTSLQTSCWATSMSMAVLSTSTSHRAPRPLILTSISKTEQWKTSI